MQNLLTLVSSAKGTSTTVEVEIFAVHSFSQISRYLGENLRPVKIFVYNQHTTVTCKLKL